MSLLSQQAVDELRRVCENPMNWTDGGHWFGSGHEPACFGKRATAISEHKTTIYFQTDNGVLAWNKACEDAARHTNTAFSALTGALVFMAAIPALTAFGVGVLVTHGNNILTASENFPTVLKGWSIEITSKYITVQSTVGNSSFQNIVSLKVMNSAGVNIFERKEVYDFPQTARTEFLSRLSSRKNTMRTIIK
jgi:hypothetical protein